MPFGCNFVISANLMPVQSSLRARALLDKIIRVDQAGELGAKYIYKAQLCVLKKKPTGCVIKVRYYCLIPGLCRQHMMEQEEGHLAKFEELMPLNRARPSALLPFWKFGAYAMGFATALMGERAAMACTVAVESVVGDHYNDQIRQLLAEDPVAHAELLDIIKKFRDEEMEHHDTGLANEAEAAPFYRKLSQVIKLCSLTSIKAAEKI